MVLETYFIMEDTMFDLLKLITFAAGCAVIYGLATGADLNELFTHITSEAIPVLKKVIASIWEVVRGAIGN